ncbi:hypothetical protein [Plantibacter sp. CFBP 8775]|uniref:hypothetical protein n=1 Tax=Plantibacter sp. CFBP 8775 TaxID=2774038 RepID=UPI00177E9E99|nr:hypothetical protein [Plantibacter sp. CFBP 8775]MBD8104741.1 hypothetical protein [Plantibacter sp. CFBP 8775]
MMKFTKTTSALALTAILGIGGSVAVATPAAAATPTRALCGNSTVWDGKDPDTCDGIYRLYDLSSSQHGGKIIFQVDNTNYAARQAGAWAAVKGGYEAANDWCADNVLTCTVVTGIGIAIVSPLLAPSS